jgi:hypothetical protein
VKVHPVFIWAVLLLLPLSCLQAQIAPELREEGVLYFEDNLPNKIIAKVKAPVTVYLRRDFGMAAAYLGTGQQIELLGMSPEGYLVKGDYRGNTVTGWIRPEDLPSGIDPALFAQAKKNQARHDAVAVAIANKSVIPGMTPDEVKQSLGAPDQTSSRTDASGTLQTWTFTTYRQDPQYTYTMNGLGRPVLQTYYVKTPIGQLIVNFDASGVISVEEHKTNPNSPGVVTN